MTVMTEWQKRDADIRGVIAAYKARNNLDTNGMCRRMGLSKTSLSRRIKDPSELKLCELRALKLSDEEWEKIR